MTHIRKYMNLLNKDRGSESLEVSDLDRQASHFKRNVYGQFQKGAET